MSLNNGRTIEFRIGNIAEADCDAIVNPCNHGFLLGPAGVNGALAAAAGPAYALECAQLPVRASGVDVFVTGAGALQARHVIHAVSPIWYGGMREKEALRRVHERALAVAAKHACRSLALPAIGTGAHRFPPEVAASIAVPTVEALLQKDSAPERVVFVFQSRATLHDYLARSSSPNSNDVLAGGLRDEITGHLRHAKRTQLAATVDKITDETTLRVIITEARALSNKAGDDHRDNSASIGIDTVYVRAAEHVLGLEPGG